MQKWQEKTVKDNLLKTKVSPAVKERIEELERENLELKTTLSSRANQINDLNLAVARLKKDYEGAQSSANMEMYKGQGYANAVRDMIQMLRPLR